MARTEIILPCKPLVYQYLVTKYPHMKVPGVDAQVEIPIGDPVLLMLYTLLMRNKRHQDSIHTLQYYTCAVQVLIITRLLCSDRSRPVTTTGGGFVYQIITNIAPYAG